jgi:hypothetical protein
VTTWVPQVSGFARVVSYPLLLMLALLECCVRDANGRSAFCDTVSMAIVATPAGGLVPCAGGPARDAQGQAAIRALSCAEVVAIVIRFAALNLYAPTAVPGSRLKLERENCAASGQQQSL